MRGFIIMKTHDHIKFSGTLLDTLLSQGCYRMHQDIFTTDLILNGHTIHYVFWLRYPLHKFCFDKKPQKLICVNSRFEIKTREFYISKELEDLYQLYFAKTDFDAPPTIQDFLFGNVAAASHPGNLFDSEVIEIREGGKLIAAGIYDNGLIAMAGIMNFYDPAYKKYSLGKYLMLLKIQHAIKAHMQYYYPGYIAYGFDKFDYKLFPNQNLAEIFDSKKKVWLPYSKALLARLAENFDH